MRVQNALGVAYKCLAGVARHGLGYRLTRDTMVDNAINDVACTFRAVFARHNIDAKDAVRVEEARHALDEQTWR